MRNLRDWNELRTITINKDFCPNAYGSLLFEMGNTRIICAASVSEDVPDHASGKDMGWISADYVMQPYSTSPRTNRQLLKKDGRAVEIQRLISRSLRGVVDLTKLQGYSIMVDCDVIQADGGTRTASITGGFIALKCAIDRMLKEGLITENPVEANVAAVSVGYVKDALLIDLDFSEDSQADIDMNVIMDSNYNLIEVQGTGEKATFTRKQLDNMIDCATKGIQSLIEIQKHY